MLCVTCNVAKLIFISWPPDLWQKFDSFILLFEKGQCDYTKVATYLLLLSRPVKKWKAVAEFLYFVETWVLSSALGSFHRVKLYNGYCGFQIGKLYCLLRWSKYLGENWDGFNLKYQFRISISDSKPLLIPQSLLLYTNRCLCLELLDSQVAMKT